MTYKRLFLIQAAGFNVLPLDDVRSSGCCRNSPADDPVGTKQVLYPGMSGLNENCVLNVKNRSHSITAQMTIPAGDANGVLVNQGGITGRR